MVITDYYFVFPLHQHLSAICKAQLIYSICNFTGSGSDCHFRLQVDAHSLRQLFFIISIPASDWWNASAIKCCQENKNLVQVFCDFYDLGFQGQSTTSAVKLNHSSGKSGEVLKQRRYQNLSSWLANHRAAASHHCKKCRLSGWAPDPPLQYQHFNNSQGFKAHFKVWISC